MIVAQLTPGQAEQLKGIEFRQDSFFNPIQDINDIWIISLEEQEQCSIDWVKELPLIEYLPKETTNLFDNV